MPDARQFLQAELDSDREEKQDDAYLGEAVDQFAVRHEPEGGGSNRDAGQKKANDRNEPDSVADVCQDDAGDQNCNHLSEER